MSEDGDDLSGTADCLGEESREFHESDDDCTYRKDKRIDFINRLNGLDDTAADGCYGSQETYYQSNVAVVIDKFQQSLIESGI